MEMTMDIRELFQRNQKELSERIRKDEKTEESGDRLKGFMLFLKDKYLTYSRFGSYTSLEELIKDSRVMDILYKVYSEEVKQKEVKHNGVPICLRCGEETHVHSMSYFNRDLCCPECLEKERRHPLYNKAKERELEEVRKGNYNFPGIGKPDDL